MESPANHLMQVKASRPALTPARQVDTPFTDPRGIEGWVDFNGWLYTEMV